MSRTRLIVRTVAYAMSLTLLSAALFLRTEREKERLRMLEQSSSRTVESDRSAASIRIIPLESKANADRN